MTTWTVIGRSPVESLVDLEDGTYVFMGGDGETMILDTLAESTTGYVVAVSSMNENTGPLFRGNLIGVWKDTDDNMVYVDRVEIWEDMGIAMDRAAHRGELAIWDLENSREIRV